MGTMDKQTIIIDYIESQPLGIIATVGKEGKPEAALVGVTEVGNLELVFGTPNTSRKYQNLKENSHVALVIGTDATEAITVQYEGEAEELSGEECERCKNLHSTKNPRAKKFADQPEQRWFKVRPTWIRYSNRGAEPPIEFETKL